MVCVKSRIIWGCWRRCGRGLTSLMPNIERIKIAWKECDSEVNLCYNSVNITHSQSESTPPPAQMNIAWSSCRGSFGSARFQLTPCQLFLPQHISAAPSVHQLQHSAFAPSSFLQPPAPACISKAQTAFDPAAPTFAPDQQLIRLSLQPFSAASPLFWVRVFSPAYVPSKEGTALHL